MSSYLMWPRHVDLACYQDMVKSLESYRGALGSAGVWAERCYTGRESRLESATPSVPVQAIRGWPTATLSALWTALRPCPQGEDTCPKLPWWTPPPVTCSATVPHLLLFFLLDVPDVHHLARADMPPTARLGDFSEGTGSKRISVEESERLGRGRDNELSESLGSRGPASHCIALLQMKE